MSRFSPEIWDRLRNAQPAGDRLVAKPASTDADMGLLCAVDRAMQRHLLITVAADAEDWNDRESRGLGIATRELLVVGKPPQRYIDIECRDSAGHPILDGIAGEICEKLSAGAVDITGQVRKIIAQCRRFWGQVPQNLLSREEQIGLFGELLFLHNRLIPAVGTEEAVRR
jgi:hypothetical protein